MPTYVFHDTETDTYEEEFMSISAMEAKLEANPQMKLVLHATDTIEAARMGRMKPDDSFNDILKNIKSKHLHNTIKTWG
jgi:hypothetical protein